MDKIIKNASFYVKGRKVATAKTAKLSLADNSDIVVGDGVVLGQSSGVTTGTLSVTTATVYGGTESTRKLTRALLNKEYMDVQYGPDDGSMFMLKDWRVTSHDSDADMPKGDQTGAFTLSGGVEAEDLVDL